jgi:hypothetical protein
VFHCFVLLFVKLALWSFGVWLISQQHLVLFSRNKSATSTQYFSLGTNQHPPSAKWTGCSFSKIWAKTHKQKVTRLLIFKHPGVFRSKLLQLPWWRWCLCQFLLTLNLVQFLKWTAEMMFVSISSHPQLCSSVLDINCLTGGCKVISIAACYDVATIWNAVWCQTL